jgi:hypothetical protein
MRGAYIDLQPVELDRVHLTTRPICSLEHSHGMPLEHELPGHDESGYTRADDENLARITRVLPVGVRL